MVIASKSWAYFIGFIILSLQLCAESTITITLINNSDTTLILSRTTANQGATIAIDKNVVKPGEHATVVGTVTDAVDLNATVFWNDDDNRFTARVRRLKHFGQPSFVAHGKSLTAVIDEDSLRFNGDGIPNHLSFTAATVLLETR